MNKILNTFCVALLVLCLSLSLSGCTFVKDQIKEYSEDKEQCTLNTENVTQFTYQGNSYTILDTTVANGNLGEWVGYIRQLAAVDDSGVIVRQEYVEDATFHSLADLTEIAPTAKYIVPFLNVYVVPNDASYLIVDVNGGYHKAIPSEQVTGSDAVFNFKAAAEKTARSFEVNPLNATQIVCGDKVYQVTLETVRADQLGNYLDTLAEHVVFDANTKLPLTKEEQNKIDWSGASSNQQRERWFYLDVREITGAEAAEMVAVKVNSNYYVARAL